jgi:hypothetical protein
MGQIPAAGDTDYRMLNLPAIPDAYQPKFDKMWQSACRVCDNILAYQPDLVVALMHSGWGPVFAAQTLWQQTQTVPFPPVVRTNIGREKIDLFDETHNSITAGYFVGEYSSDIDVGKLLAWVASRVDWHEQLRRQVAEAMKTPQDPLRILLIDDCVHEGSTSILALGLIDCVFPQAKVRFLNADSWYRTTYMDFLLDVLCPRSELFPEGKIPSEEVRTQLGRVAVGSENAPDHSLYWQPISVESPAVQALSVYRPASDWVQSSKMIYATIARHITEHAVSYVPSEPRPGDFNYGLRISWCMMRDIWLENGITRRTACLRYGTPDQEFARILDSWWAFNDVVLQGHGRGTRYMIPEPVRRYVEKQAILPADPLNAYWLLPGKLMFGEPPWYHEKVEVTDEMRSDIRYLLNQAVDYWLDVQIVQEGETAQENPLFVEEARAIGRTAVAQFITLPMEYVSEEGYILTRRGRPNRKDIRPILDRIDQLLADGRVLYVSAVHRNLRGILAGCYLARHGQAGSAALAALQACRATAASSWKREPVSRQARRYVRSWPAGL